jgi:hypothetical protein
MTAGDLVFEFFFELIEVAWRLLSLCYDGVIAFFDLVLRTVRKRGRNVRGRAAP